MASETFGGIIPAVFTPFAADGSLALENVVVQAEALRGVDTVFVGGTTGESMSLTVAERKAVVEAWMALKAPLSKRVIVQAGTATLRDAVELAAHAKQVGAAAVGAMPPFFFKPGSLEDLVGMMKQIAAACAPLPFFYYHIPSMTHVPVLVHEFLAAAAPQIPNLVGAKFSHSNLHDFGLAAAAQGGKFTMLSGGDETLVAALAMGARGAVGSTYNFAAPLYNAITAAFHAGKVTEALRLQRVAMDFVGVINFKYRGLPGFKATLELLGKGIGRTVRAPLQALSDAEVEQLRADLDAVDFFSHVPPYAAQ